MSVKKKPMRGMSLTATQVRRLIAKERKIWEAERLQEKLGKQLPSAQIETARAYGRCLTENDRLHIHYQANCTHRKGGTINDLGRPGSALYKGTSPQYAVIKHQMMHRDIWVRCLRCGKWWKPPVRSHYKQDRDFWRAMFEYEEALNFPTNNTTSGSVLCNFSKMLPNGSMVDATEIVREALANAAGY